MTRRPAILVVFLTITLIIVALAVDTFLSVNHFPDLERDARRLAAYLEAKERCGLEGPAGGVDGVAGKYDFDPKAARDFEKALEAARTKEADRAAKLSEAEYCDHAGRAMP